MSMQHVPRSTTHRDRRAHAARLLRRILPIAIVTVVMWYAVPAALALETGIDFGTATGLSTQDIRITVAKIIRAALALLGIIVLGITLYGGYLWMTAGGSDEKIIAAKQWLTNGAIGLTIILLAFSITQFVLSRLTDAAASSGVRSSVAEYGFGLPEGALPGGCGDPGGTAPYLCSATPSRAGVGAYVTLRGYRFGAFTDGASGVRVGGMPARIVACAGAPNWSEHLVVIELPSLAVGRAYPITLTRADGVGNANAVTVGVSDETLGPQVGCVVPDTGAPGTSVTVEGKLFGSAAGMLRFAGDADAVTSEWTNERIAATVPNDARSGELRVLRDAAVSNGYPFGVTCTMDAQCGGGGACVEGQCVERPMASTVGASCDTDAVAPSCQPGTCGGGLRCSANSCTCVEGPTITAVSPSDLAAAATGAVYANEDAVPAGVTASLAPNGAPGNYLTVRGHGFGESRCSQSAARRCRADADCGEGDTCLGVGRITFLGGSEGADDRPAALAACAAAWSDTEVVVAVPEGVAAGPIRIETAAGWADATDDARGPVIAPFVPNDVRRPGVCSVQPPRAAIGASVEVRGVQFGDARGGNDALLFGDVAAPDIPDASWNPTMVRGRVPAIAAGLVELRMRVGNILSNAVSFTRESSVAVPRIREMVPSRGGPGQYVTIRGEHFGGTVGKVVFRKGNDAYEVIPRFPETCQQEWWRDGEITVRIPANASEWGPPAPPDGFEASGTYDVRVEARDGMALRPSANTVPFIVTNDPATPGICAIVPSSGPQRTPVRIIGDGFGGEGTVEFTEGVRAGEADRVNEGTETFAWGMSAVRGMRVPASARTGPVRLWSGADVTAPGAGPKEGRTDAASNPVMFTVRDCRSGGFACSEGTMCCADGTCRTSCTAAPNTGAYQWTFATGIVPKIPRVVESCDGGAPSPSPWDQQGQGRDACANANITVAFTQTMNLDVASAASGVRVFACRAGTNAARAFGGAFAAANDLTGWRVVDAADAAPLANTYLTAAHATLDAPRVPNGDRGVLALTKRLPRAPAAPRAAELPSDATVDRHHFAIEAPEGVLDDTNGTTYTARVFVRGKNPKGNPNRRAGIVIGRRGGPEPSRAGWYQQAAQEVVLNGTWQELAVGITFDSGMNARASGFVRLYLTAPPADEPAGDDEIYGATFDAFEVVRAGDPCAVRAPAATGLLRVGSTGGRLELTNNVITIAPPIGGGWDPDTTYEVIVAGTTGAVGTDVGGAPIVLTALTGAASGNLRLDGDRDGAEGGNYRFRFQTRASTERCAIQSVAVLPDAVTATQPGPEKAELLGGRTTAEDPGLAHLRADGIGDAAACFTLDASGTAWTWGADLPELASVEASGGRWCTTSRECGVVACTPENARAACGAGVPCGADGTCAFSFCSDFRCAFTPPGAAANLFANTATAVAHRETPFTSTGTPTPVHLTATVAAETPRSGRADMVVRFERPRVVSVLPVNGCTEACTNAVIAAVLNVELNAVTVRADAASVSLAVCAQENCRRGDLAPVTGATVTACPGRPLTTTAAEPALCASQRVSDAPQLLITLPAHATLLPNRSYRVTIVGGDDGVRSRWGAPLDGLQYDRDGDGMDDAFSWVFRTRAEACAIAAVRMVPETVTFHALGERAAVTAVPASAPDRCAPEGQPLIAAALPWSWELRNADDRAPDTAVAGFTRVNPAGGFAPPAPDARTRTAPVADAACTLQCVRPGSRRVSGICGNNILETPAEECERLGADGQPSASGGFPSWCDPASCLRQGTRPVREGGACGNGAVDAGEECDAERRCAVGTARARAACTTDADCAADGATPQPGACAPVFASWCDTHTCLHIGVAAGSVCGNGDVGDGEDCDDGNARSGDGCSSRCLAEGTPPARSADYPDGLIAACGDGIVADGRAGRPNGGEECDLGLRRSGETPDAERERWRGARCDFDRCVWTGTASVADRPAEAPLGAFPWRCGDGVVQPGEQCDDGMVGTCALASDRAGARCSAHGDCGAGGVCEDLGPVSGDGCSAACLLEGSSLAWQHARTDASQPSQCGDGAVPSYDNGRSSGGEACDAGSAAGPADPTQLIAAVGSGAVGADGTQRATVAASVSAVRGRAQVLLQCGFPNDQSCQYAAAGITPATYGVNRDGCCALRPVRTTAMPAAGATGVCRNTQVTVRFNRELDPASVGVATDPATRATYPVGATLERTDGTRVVATPVVVSIADERGERTSEIRFELAEALAPTTTYRVRIFGADDDRSGRTVSARSADGIRYGGSAAVDGGSPEPQNVWTWTTGTTVCALDRVAVVPPSYLLQRIEDRAPFTATAFTRSTAGDLPIVSVPGYGWTYAWYAAAPDIATIAKDEQGNAACAGNRCTFAPATPVRQGSTRAVAAAVLDATNTSGVPGSRIEGSAALRTLLCANPWPAVVTPGTWSPFPRPTDTSALIEEHMSIAYCRDFGNTSVCRIPGTDEDGSERSCARDSDCTEPGTKCLPSLRDDLPSFGDPQSSVERVLPVTEAPDELRKEFLFFPRGAFSCSGSRARCDPRIAGMCPEGESCREGNDAIGVRIYENPRHVDAATWYRNQGFTEPTEAVTIAGYRGVRTPSAVYLNAANTGSVYTNIVVVSASEGASVETQEILARVLAGLQFTTDLAAATTNSCAFVTSVPARPGRCTTTTARRCGLNGPSCRTSADCQRDGPQRCAVSGAVCTSNARCPGEDRCVAARCVQVGRCEGTGTACGSNAQCTAVPAEEVVTTGRRCTGSSALCTRDADCGTGGTCGQEVFRCASDLECRVGAAQGLCAVPAEKLARDVQRVEDLLRIGEALERYGVANPQCAISGRACSSDTDCGDGDRCVPGAPNLAGGSYLAGMTTSRWPSWQEAFGRALAIALPTDPLNRFGGPCATGAGAEGYEAATCWSQSAQQFRCPAGSYLYQYRRTSGGAATVIGALEYAQGSTWIPAITGVDVTGGACATGRAYGVSGSCGDGVVQGDEQCDPPGTAQAANACTPANGAPNSGLQYRTCQRDCQWSPLSACTATCGNGVLDAGEQCDAGPAGGPVRAAGGTTPGVTAATQYACSRTCQWTGGSCGDGVIQPAYGEQCDGMTGVALAPVQSSAQSTYQCTSASASEPNPCRYTGGYCGDGTVQPGEECDGSTSRPCTVGTSVVSGGDPSGKNRFPAGTVLNTGDVPQPGAVLCENGYNTVPGQWATLGATTCTDPTNGNVIPQSYEYTVEFTPEGGDVALTLVTANGNTKDTTARGDDLSELTADAILRGVMGGRTLADYHPSEVRAATGVYHRIRIEYRKRDGSLGSVILWALAANQSNRQTNRVVLTDAAGGPQRISLYFTNDWYDGERGLDSNVTFISLTFSGEQALECGSPGSAAACTATAWRACQPPRSLCGNGRVDDGEECDDGGRGRCSQDAQRTCVSDAECNFAGARGNTCLPDSDACTARCRRNVCGDGAQLAPSCIGGSREGLFCRTSEDCGGGACRSEACDLGVANWQAACASPADTQCVPNARCPYGRACNYCVANSCTVVTRQGSARSCIASPTILRGNDVLASDSRLTTDTPTETNTDEGWIMYQSSTPDRPTHALYGVTIADTPETQSRGADVRMVLTTANHTQDVSGVAVNNPALNRNATAGRSATGVYHHLRVSYWQTGASATTSEDVWALASSPDRPQESVLTLTGLRPGGHTVLVEWLNDANVAGQCANATSTPCRASADCPGNDRCIGAYDVNVRIHRVQFASDQPLLADGTWGACVPSLTP